MKRLLLIFLLLISCLNLHSQTTYIDGAYTTGGKLECGRLKSVEIRNDGVIVTIEVKALKELKRLKVFSSENTYVLAGGAKVLALTGLLINGQIKDCGFGTNWGWNDVKVGETRTYSLFFRGTMPDGATNFSMVDEGDYHGTHGYCFSNYRGTCKTLCLQEV